MTKSKPPSGPRTTSTDTFRAVEKMRKKLDSIDENTMPVIEEAVAAADRALASLPPASTTPEEQDAIKIPVVVVEEKKPPDQ
jgi:hypothetical protein